MAANDRCSPIITLGELTTCLRTPFAEMPYRMKTINVIAMNTTLRINISNIGDEVFGETKSGRKAKKNIDSLGFSRVFATIFVICSIFFLGRTI